MARVTNEKVLSKARAEIILYKHFLLLGDKCLFQRKKTTLVNYFDKWSSCYRISSDNKFSKHFISKKINLPRFFLCCSACNAKINKILPSHRFSDILRC